MVLTLSVSSFQAPPTPLTSAWPPSLPSVPTSRATRVTSLAKRRSWSTSVLTVLAVLRNWPCKRRPSISSGIVCDRSPPATARMTRPISMFGRERSSMRALMASSAAATRAAGPVQFAGMRAEKSPRLTAVSTLSVTLGSTDSVVTARRANADILPLVFALWSERNPEIDAGSGPGLAVEAAPSAREVRAFAHGDQAKVSGQMEALGHDEPGPIIGDGDADAAVHGLGSDAYARRVAVLLDIAQRLGDVLEHIRLHDSGKCVRKADVQLRFYAGVLLERHRAVADRVAEPHVQVD